MNMPFDPTSSNSQIWEFTSIGTFHFHYEETLTNCTVTAPDVDGTLTSEAENGGIGVYLVADGIGHVANQYQGSIGAFFNVTVTYSCPPQADRVVVYPWPEEFFVNSTRTDVLSAGTGSGSYEVDVGGGGGSQKSDTYDWNLQVTGL
jgi:hypothetical protein